MLLSILVLIALIAITAGLIIGWSTLFPNLPRLMEVVVTLAAGLWLLNALNLWSWPQ